MFLIGHPKDAEPLGAEFLEMALDLILGLSSGHIGVPSASSAGGADRQNIGQAPLW